MVSIITIQIMLKIHDFQVLKYTCYLFTKSVFTYTPENHGSWCYVDGYWLVSCDTSLYSLIIY